MPSPINIDGVTTNNTPPNRLGTHNDFPPNDDNSVLSQSRDSNSVLPVLPDTTTHDVDSLGFGGDEANIDLITGPNHGTFSSTRTSILNEFTEESMVIAQDTMKTFSVGAMYDTFDDLLRIAKEFARSKSFTVRKSGRNMIVCSRSSNWNSKLKEDGKRVQKKLGHAVACGCTWMLKISLAKSTLPNARLTAVEPHHNHQCNQAAAVVSYKKSGKGADEAISQITRMLAPLILSKRPLSYNLVWWTIEPYLAPGILLDSKAVGNILRGVRARIGNGDYTSPPPTVDFDTMRRFTTVDITSGNCGQVLQELISNSNGDNSWTTSRLMNRLKDQDQDYFDFRLKYDANDQIEVVTWQVGLCRGAYERYGRKIFLDVKHTETMNIANMKHMSFIGIDDNKQIVPFSETFLFEESNELYECGVTFTIDMTPGMDAANVLFGWGDLFLSPEIVKKWFPNIIWQVDSYHFCSRGNKSNILRKDFGPSNWAILQDSMIAAVFAKTERECIVSQLCSIKISVAYIIYSPTKTPRFFTGTH